MALLRHPAPRHQSLVGLIRVNPYTARHYPSCFTTYSDSSISPVTRENSGLPFQISRTSPNIPLNIVPRPVEFRSLVIKKKNNFERVSFPSPLPWIWIPAVIARALTCCHLTRMAPTSASKPSRHPCCQSRAQHGQHSPTRRWACWLLAGRRSELAGGSSGRHATPYTGEWGGGTRTSGSVSSVSPTRRPGYGSGPTPQPRWRHERTTWRPWPSGERVHASTSRTLPGSSTSRARPMRLTSGGRQWRLRRHFSLMREAARKLPVTEPMTRSTDGTLSAWLPKEDSRLQRKRTWWSCLRLERR